MLRCVLLLVGFQNALTSLPPLPISKIGAPVSKREVMFVVDVSQSLRTDFQNAVFDFVVQAIIDTEKHVQDAKYGCVIFGVDGRQISKRFEVDGLTNVTFPPPYGNGAQASTELLFGLGSLKYDCPECGNVTSKLTNYSGQYSQLNMLRDVAYAGWLSPTWDGLDLARQELATKGDPNVPDFIILLTDGPPNAGTCVPSDPPSSAGCVGPYSQTNVSAAAIKSDGIQLMVILPPQMNNGTAPAISAWASDEKLAVIANYSVLIDDVVPQTTELVAPSPNQDSAADLLQISWLSMLCLAFSLL